MTMTTDITELAQRKKFEAWFKSSFHPDKTGPYIKDQLYFAWKAAGAELVEDLEKAQETIAFQQGEIKALLSSLESRTVTVKLPDSLDFDCEMENGDYDIDEEPYLRGKIDGFNYALTKIRRLNDTAGIKWEAE